MKTSYDERYFLQNPEMKSKIQFERIQNVVYKIKNQIGALLIFVGTSFPNSAGATSNIQIPSMPNVEMTQNSNEKQPICGEGDFLFGLIPDPSFFFPEVCNPLFQERNHDGGFSDIYEV